MGNSSTAGNPELELPTNGLSGARPAELQTLKETDLLTRRGGILAARNQNRDPEPSAKPLRDSD